MRALYLFHIFIGSEHQLLDTCSLFPLNLNINYLGYTESHYTGLVHLHYRFKNSPVGFNILAFPCNQFGNQEYVVFWFWCFPTLFVVPSLPPHIMLRPHISTQYCFLLSTGQRNVLRLNYLPSKRVWNLWWWTRWMSMDWMPPRSIITWRKLPVRWEILFSNDVSTIFAETSIGNKLTQHDISWCSMMLAHLPILFSLA